MKLLLLAGTSEAAQLAKRLIGHAKIDVIASLAGATRQPADLGVTTRKGGFGGISGLCEYLSHNKIDAVVDATHPFASQMTQNALGASKQTKTPHLILQREGWTPRAQDNWFEIERYEDLHDLIPEGARVFLGTGRQTLKEFKDFNNRELFMRVIDKPVDQFPFPKGQFVIGRPPFPVEDEITYFKSEKIDWLVVKNSGGVASRSKLDAAALLGLPVAMIKRPNMPEADRVSTAEEALLWLEAACEETEQ